VTTSTTTTLVGSCSGSFCPCDVAPSFDSIGCRLGVLIDAVPGTLDRQAIRQRVGRQLDRARVVLGVAERRCAAAADGPARRSLHKMGHRLARAWRALHRQDADRAQAAVESMAGTTAQLMVDTSTLAGRLSCPY
jgi:hypothetical protein